MIHKTSNTKGHEYNCHCHLTNKGAEDTPPHREFGQHFRCDIRPSAIKRSIDL